jgi:threonine/homoserine/homoserine lactone efflux protein
VPASRFILDETSRESSAVTGDLSAFAAAAVGIAVSPLPFLFAIALLGTSRPARNALAFISGEALAIAGIATLAVVLVSDGDGTVGPLKQPLSVLEIVVGALFAALLVVHLRRPRSEERPRWSSVLDRVGPRGAFAGGLAMVAANPKNLALTLAGAASIAQLGYSAGGQAASIVGFTAIAVSLLVGLLLVAVSFPERSSATFSRAQAAVYARERVVVAWVLGLLAAFFLVRGLLGTLS